MDHFLAVFYKEAEEKAGDGMSKQIERDRILKNIENQGGESHERARGARIT